METWRSSRVKTFADAKKYQAVVAGTGPTSSSVVFPKIMNDQLGTKFKLAPGFQGQASATLAMQRGEVEGVVRPWADLKAKNPDWITQRLINPIVQFSIVRDAEIANVPAIVDLATTAAQRRLFSLFASGDDVGDSILAPPGAPPDVLAALRAGYDATVKDPEFLAAAARAKSDIKPLNGADLTKLNASLFETWPDIVKLAKSYSGVQ